MINLSVSLSPTNLKSISKTVERQKKQGHDVRKPPFHSGSCHQVTFGQSFNLSRLLFFHPLHEGLTGDDDSAGIIRFQTERTFRKEIKWNNSYDGRQSILVLREWIWRWRGFRTQLDMNLRESLVFITQVGREDSINNLCQALSTMHDIHN